MPIDTNKTASEKLYDLWHQMKAEGSCTDYVKEMCSQLELLGTETNTLTRQMVHDELSKSLDKIKRTL